MTTSIELITRIEDVSDETITRWNQLAPNPFLRWEWLGSWARSYGNVYRPLILLVRQGEEIIGVAPWCIENRISIGRTLQFMGSGKACTDHLTLLVDKENQEEVCKVAAKWLAQVHERNDLPSSLQWDAIEWVGIDAGDPVIDELVVAMGSEGLQVERSEGLGCYGIELPATWDEYVQRRSKSGRREIRQSMKPITEGLVELHAIQTIDQLNQYWDDFVSLHQRRRHASGTTGCFDHYPFGDFLRLAAEELLQVGLLKFVVATQGNRPVAAQFALADENNWYFYQSGMDPDAASLRPGMGIFCYAIRETIESGRQRFDMMRGDEPYKQRWRAELQATEEIRVCSPRATARVRHSVFQVTRQLKHLVQSGMGLNHQH